MKNIRLVPEKLTEDNFADFGEVVSIQSKQSKTINNGFADKYADIASLDTSEDQGQTSVHIFVAKSRQFPLHISMLEKHPFFSQTFIPRHSSPFIVVVAPPEEIPSIEKLKAFITNGEQGISYSRGVWHFPLISMNDNSQFIVIDRKHNEETDTIEQCKEVSLDNISVGDELMMQIYLIDWLNLALKLLHVIAGIAWIGASFYFNWLENKLDRLNNRDEIAGNLWAVHGGGFYHLEKYKKYPQTLPEPLHWFKWEAYVTWLSGISLLSVIYYFNASTYLLATNSSISAMYGIGLSLLGLLAFWLIYDILCKSKLVNKSAIFIAIIFLVVSFFAYFYSNIFNPRAVYMQIGAMVGTVMVANVFFVIIPVQKKLVDACENSTEVSLELGKTGYIRSRHNNYFTLPVLFMMISGHYPTIYSGDYGWLVLIAVIGILVMVRHYFNLRGVGKAKNSLIAIIAVSTLALIYLLAPSQSKDQAQNKEVVTIAEAQVIIEKHCVSCHAEEPSNMAFAIAPNGIMLDTIENIITHKDQIYKQAVLSKAMPIINTTNMTDEEREKLGAWVEAN